MEGQNTTSSAQEDIHTEPPYQKGKEYVSILPEDTRKSTGSDAVRRQRSRASTKETVDPNLDINLPYRTLSHNANLEEYTAETAQGEINSSPRNDGERYMLVTFIQNDPENPKNWSKLYKWYCTIIVALTCFVVAFASSVITADIGGVSREFDVSNEVALISISIFVVGFGIGEYEQIYSK
jgi:hypothetical protein